MLNDTSCHVVSHMASLVQHSVAWLDMASPMQHLLAWLDMGNKFSMAMLLFNLSIYKLKYVCI